MDKIHINNLEIFAKHGVFPEEKCAGSEVRHLSSFIYRYQKSRNVGPSGRFD